MRGVEVGRAQFRMRLRVETDRAHERERLGDPVREFLVALGLRALFDEAEHPTVGVLEIGVAAARERAQQVERRGGLAIGLDLPSRIGLARLRRELDIVDDVAAIGRQRDAADRLDVGRARLGELPGDAPHLHDRRRRREGHHHRHLQEDAEEIPNVVCGMLGEALRAIAPLQQKGLARRRLAQRPFELARLACKNQRRIARELALHRRQRRVIGIDRGLLDRLGPPALGTPIRLRHRPTPLNSRRDAIRPPVPPREPSIQEREADGDMDNSAPRHLRRRARVGAAKRGWVAGRSRRHFISTTSRGTRGRPHQTIQVPSVIIST